MKRGELMNKQKLFCVLVFIFIYLQFQTNSYADVDVSKLSRVILNVRDTQNYLYKVYFFTSKETKSDFYICGGGEDKVYIGDYKFGIQKYGTKEIKVMPLILKGYPFNETKKTVFSLKAKSKMYPDLIVVSNQIDCNTKIGKLYYINKGNLVQINNSLSFVSSPRFNESNKLETMNYYNTEDLPWVLSTYSLDLKSGSLKFLDKKSFSFEEGKIIDNNW